MEAPPTSRALEDKPGASFSMVDVGEKPETFRRAVARGLIQMSADVLSRVEARTVPKGDVLSLAEVAGIQAAKKTSDWLPLCHPLLLDKVKVRCLLDPQSRAVVVESEVSGTGKTGFEMEALTAVSAALLCVYDLVKALDPAMTIRDIRLLEKEGGKSGHWTRGETSVPREPAKKRLAGLSAAVITVSDRVSRGESPDKSGPRLKEFLEAEGATVAAHRTVPDEKSEIAATVRELARESRLVLLTGGTGFSPRDVTPEAIEEACDRLVPGIGEKLRQEGAKHTPLSFLSRSTAGLLGRSLVIALPGSLKAVSEGLDALAPLLPHALHVAAGGDHSRHASSDHGKDKA